MTTRCRKTIGISVAAVCAGVWIVPLYRAWSLFEQSRAYMAETGSINAATDLMFSRDLLVSYLTAILVGILLPFLYIRRPRLPVLLPTIAIIYSAIHVLLLRPESPIVFFPTMRPWFPGQIGIVAGLIGIYFYIGKMPANETE